MDIAELANTLYVPSTLDLTSILPDGSIKSFYQDLTDSRGLMLNLEHVQPVRDSEGNLASLRLVGITSLMGFDGLRAEIELEQINATLTSRVTVALLDTRLAFPGFSQFSVGELEILLEVSDSTLPFKATASGTLSLFTDIRLSMTYPAVNNQWVLTGTFEQPKDLLDMAAVMGGGNLAAHLPGFLQNALDFKVHDLEVVYDAGESKLRNVTMRAFNAATIEVMPEFFLSNITLEASALYGARQTDRVQIFCSIAGEIQAGTAQKFPENGSLVITAAAPDFRFSGTLSDEAQISLTGIMHYVLGSDTGFPDLAIDQLRFSADPRDGSYAFDFGIQPGWSLGSGTDGPQMIALDQMMLHLEKATGGASASASTQLTITDSTLTLFGAYQSGTGWTFSGSTSGLSLQAVVDAFLPNTTLPDEVPDLLFDSLELSFSPPGGAFTLAGRCAATWELPFGVAGFAVSTVDFALRRAASTPGEQGIIECSLALAVAGPIPVVDGLEFQSGTLRFRLNQAARTWLLDGSIAASVFGTDLTLVASLQQTAADRTIRLSTTLDSSRPLVQVGPASLDASSLTITISKALQGAASGRENQVNLNTNSPYSWAVTAAGSIVLQDLLNFDGNLALFKEAARTGLIFKARDPNAATATITLPVPNNPVEIAIGLGSVAVIRTPQGWTFDATARVSFAGLPHQIQNVLADKTTGRFAVDSTGVLVTVDRLLDPVELDIPATSLGSQRIDFGKVLLDASNFSLRVSSGQPVLSVDFGFGLPQNLNHIFGTKRENGREVAAVNFFNTYDPARTTQLTGPGSVPHNDSVTQFRLGYNTSAGLTFQMVTSPIRAIRFQATTTTTTVDVNLDKYGKLHLVVPNFSFNGTAFSATGGFTQENLQIPLKPIKELLNQCGLDTLSAMIPDGMPLLELHAFDDNGNLRVDDFIMKLGLPAAVREPLEFLADRIEQLPDLLKTTYLNMDIPERFSFDLALAPDGSFSLDIKVEGDRPLKLLNWGSSPTGIPGLIGIELHRFKIRAMAGGTLLLTKIDANVDFFDIVTLAAAVAVPTDELAFLPDSRTLHSRIILDKLVALVIYQTGIPIPIPLFYDQVGYEYLGLEGLELQAHLGFKPRIQIGQVQAAFGQFEAFFTQRDALLDPNQISNVFELALEVGPTYIKLPKYLGGSVLGPQGGLPPLRPVKTIAHVLNAMKTLSLSEIVQALPLDRRVGAVDIEFACLRARAAWAITTSDEFSKVLLDYSGPQLDFVTSLKALPPADQNDLLALARIGTSGTPDPKQGLLTFLWGGWNVANLLNIDARFGLALVADQGFGAGFAFKGTIGAFFQFYARGLVMINRDNHPTIQAEPASAGSKQTVSMTPRALEQRLQAEMAQGNASLSELVKQEAQLMQRLGQLGGEAAVLQTQVAQLQALSALPGGSANARRLNELHDQLAQKQADIQRIQTELVSLQQHRAPVMKDLQVKQVQLAQAQKQVEAAKTFRIEGDSSLQILDHRVFTATLRADDEHFYLDGTLALFPPSSPLQVGGSGILTINPGGEVYFHSAASVSLAKFTLVSAEITITNNSVQLMGQWLGVRATFELFIQGNRSALRGTVGLNFALKASLGPILVPSTRIKLVDSLQLDTACAASIAVTLSNAGFTATVTGSFAWQGTTLTLPSFTLSVSVESIAELTDKVIAQLQSSAYALFGSLFQDAQKYLGYLKSGVVSLTGDVAEVLNAHYKMSKEAAARALRELGRTWDSVATSLRQYYRLSDEVTAQVIKDAGATAEQAGRAIQTAFSVGKDRAAEILSKAGYSADQTIGALRIIYNVSADDTARYLKSFYKQSATDIARTLNRVYGLGDEATARVLKGLQMGALETGQALKAVFNTSKDRAAQIYHTVGYTANDAAKSLRTVFNASADETARYMNSLYQLGDNAVKGIIEGAGYAATEVTGAMKSVFQWGEKAVDTIEKTADKVIDKAKDPDTWNPSKWG
jgi:hypothetical protein